LDFSDQQLISLHKSWICLPKAGDFCLKLDFLTKNGFYEKNWISLIKDLPFPEGTVAEFCVSDWTPRGTKL